MLLIPPTTSVEVTTPGVHGLGPLQSGMFLGTSVEASVTEQTGVLVGVLVNVGVTVGVFVGVKVGVLVAV